MTSKVDVFVGNPGHETLPCSKISEELQRISSQICSALETIRTEMVTSADLRQNVNQALVTCNWKTQVLVTNSLPLGFPMAVLRVNGLLDLGCPECNIKHRIVINCMFDNRQAIGTNLLKLSLALDQFNSQDMDCLAIGICISDGAKKRNNWDASIPTYNEYSTFLRIPYAQLIDTRCTLWEISF